MKTKEQLADEHINDEYPKDLYSTDERSDAQMTFLAGYDARDAQLKELPEFDETILREAYLEREDIIDDLTRWEALSLGARWQHQQDAKVIAAKDEKLQVTEKLLYMSDKKIRELEIQSAEVALNGLKVYAVLQKANALIDEAFDVLCQCDLDKDGRALVEKIKQYKEIGK